MTPAQKIQLRAAEVNARLAEIAELPQAQHTDEIAAEIIALNEERKGIPDQLRKALAAEEADATLRNEGDGAFAEMAGLAAQASVGEFFSNLYEKRAHDGALAELQAHYGLGRNDLPLDLLRDGVRADVTPGPANVRRSEQPVLQPVFAMGEGAYLGVSMPTVEAGDATFPVLTTRPTVGGPHTDSTAVDETDGAFASEVLQPTRLQASFFYRRTDATRFPQMDQALRSALAMGLSEKVDSEVVAQIVADVSRTEATAADTFSSYRKRLVYDRIDGRFAMMEGDIRALVGHGTLAHMSGLYRGNNADDSALDSVRRISDGVRVSAHIAAVASDKQDAIVRRGMRRDMVCPLWRGVHIIFDEVTKANTGEIVLTAVLQHAKKVIRAAGFARVETQHA